MPVFGSALKRRQSLEDDDASLASAAQTPPTSVQAKRRRSQRLFATPDVDADLDAGAATPRRRGGVAFFSPVPLPSGGGDDSWSAASSATRAILGWQDVLDAAGAVDWDGDANAVDWDAAAPLARRCGVPVALRGAAWRAWTRRACADDAGFDAAFLERSPDQEDLRQQLDKDVKRTLGDMAYFKGGDGACVLTRLLGAAALAEPELGYVQGMNYVAAFILVVLSHAAENDVVETPRRTQVRAFSTLRGATRLLRGYYEPGFCMLKRDVAVFEALLEKHEPKLAEALLASGVDAITYAPRFLMPIFLNALPGAVNARLWDVLLSSCCGEVGDVHSDAASAVLLWALLAVCHAAAPAALALAHDRRGDDPTSFFVDLQDVLLDAAASTPSWERLCRAPVSVENVLDAISAHGRADAAPPSPADVLPEDAPAAAEAPRREQFPRTFDLLRRLVVPPRFVDSRWRGREQPYRYNPSRPYRYSPLAATPHARGTNVEMTPTNDAWPAPTNDATIADFERAMV